MPFANPVMAGAQLVRNAMQSLGFASGSSGWQIRRDGSAEFNNVTVRGTFAGLDYVINQSGAFYYSGAPAAGNLVASSTGAAGTDQYGNAYLAYVTSYGSTTPANFFAVQSGYPGAPGPGTFYYAATSPAGPWFQMASVTIDGADNLNITAGLGTAVNVNSPLKATAGTAAAPTLISTDTWHAVSLPAGVTGTIRVKLLAEAKFAALDVDVTIASTLTTGTSYAAGALPSAAYYPTGPKQRPLTVNQGMGTSPTIPRVAVPTSGALSLLMPGFTTAGLACVAGGTVVYPLD